VHLTSLLVMSATMPQADAKEVPAYHSAEPEQLMPSAGAAVAAAMSADQDIGLREVVVSAAMPQAAATEPTLGADPRMCTGASEVMSEDAGRHAEAIEGKEGDGGSSEAGCDGVPHAVPAYYSAETRQLMPEVKPEHVAGAVAMTDGQIAEIFPLGPPLGFVPMIVGGAPAAASPERKGRSPRGQGAAAEAVAASVQERGGFSVTEEEILQDAPTMGSVRGASTVGIAVVTRGTPEMSKVEGRGASDKVKVVEGGFLSKRSKGTPLNLFRCMQYFTMLHFTHVVTVCTVQAVERLRQR